MRIEAAKLSPAKCKIKARMRIEAANFFGRTYVDRRTTEISTVKRTTWGSLRLVPIRKGIYIAGAETATPKWGGS